MVSLQIMQSVCVIPFFLCICNWSVNYMCHSAVRRTMAKLNSQIPNLQSANNAVSNMMLDMRWLPESCKQTLIESYFYYWSGSQCVWAVHTVTVYTHAQANVFGWPPKKENGEYVPPCSAGQFSLPPPAVRRLSYPTPRIGLMAANISLRWE